MAEEIDGFEGSEKTPAVSWKDVTDGAVYVIEVEEVTPGVQQRNYDTDEPDWWDAEKTQPKLATVVRGTVLEGPKDTGELRALWVAKPSQLFSQLRDAQKESGVIKKGSKVSIKLVRREQVEGKKFQRNVYAVKHEAPAPVAADGFDSGKTEDPWAKPKTGTEQPTF